MNKPKKGDVLKLEIRDISSEGKGVSKIEDNFVIFVEGTVPGDIVNAEVKKVKKNFADAVYKELIHSSDMRITPKCIHFYICNGCKMQHIDYSMQLEIKGNNVLNAFERIGGFDGLNIPLPVGSKNIYHYRNKVEFSFSNDRWLTKEDMGNTDKNFALGFHRPGFAEKVIDIHDCILQIPEGNDILNFTRDFFKSKNISIYSTRTHEGFLRYLILRRSEWNNKLMLVFITNSGLQDLVKEYSLEIQNRFPIVSTFIHMIHTGKAQVAAGESFEVLYGSGYIEERLSNLMFKIEPDTFFQTNSSQAKLLFDTVIKCGEFSKDEKVLDLYCGCGAISLYISESVQSVHGVESNESSIKLAGINAEANNIKNCTFEVSDVKDYLLKISEKNEKIFDTFVIDPPRSGMHPKAVELINKLAPDKIVYVSCNPSTQARDLKELALNYKIINIQPVDMFPQTYHVENVVMLKLKNN